MTLSLVGRLFLPLRLEAQRKYKDSYESLQEESVSETADNSGEEAAEGAAGEVTDGGEDDFEDEGGSDMVIRLAQSH